MLRRLLLSTALMVGCFAASNPLHAQGAAGVSAIGSETKADTKDKNGRTPRATASNNEWIAGAQLGVRLFGEGDFADNLLGSGLIRYEVPLKSTTFGLPVFSNLADVAAKSVEGTNADTIKSAVSALLSTSQGINVGLYPYKVLSKNAATSDVRWTLFGQAVGKINSLEGRPSLTAPDTAAKVKHSLLQGRGAVGLEVAIGTPPKDNAARRPLTLSLTGVVTTFSGKTYELITGERKGHIKSIEFTAVIPVRDGAGVLFEGIGSKGTAGIWRVGMVVAAAKKDGKSDTDGVGVQADNLDPTDTCIASATENIQKEIKAMPETTEQEKEAKKKAQQDRLTAEAIKNSDFYKACKEAKE